MNRKYEAIIKSYKNPVQNFVVLCVYIYTLETYSLLQPEYHYKHQLG